MAILHRIARLLRADLNGFIDFLEEPDVMLKQALREMEDALTERERKCDLLRADYNRSLSCEVELRERLNSLEDRISLCFAENNEALAKKFIRRRLEAKKHLAAIQSSSLEKAQALERMQKSIEEDRTTYAELLEKARILGEIEHNGVADIDVSSDDVEVEFLREKRKRSSFVEEQKGGDSHEAL